VNQYERKCEAFYYCIAWSKTYTDNQIHYNTAGYAEMPPARSNAALLRENMNNLLGEENQISKFEGG